MIPGKLVCPLRLQGIRYPLSDNVDVSCLEENCAFYYTDLHPNTMHETYSHHCAIVHLALAVSEMSRLSNEAYRSL